MSLQPGPDDRPDDSALTPPSADPAATPDADTPAPAAPAWEAPPPPPAWEAQPQAPAAGWTAPPPQAPQYGSGGPEQPPAAGWPASPTPPGYGPAAGAPGGYPAPAGYAAPGPEQGAAPGYGYPTGAPGYPATGYGYGYPGYPAPRQTDSKAVVALVLAISSWVVCPVITAIVALVLAGQSDRAIVSSGGHLEGSSMNTATRWVSWANIIVMGLAIIAGLVLLVVAVGQSGITLDGSTQF